MALRQRRTRNHPARLIFGLLKLPFTILTFSFRRPRDFAKLALILILLLYLQDVSERLANIERRFGGGEKLTCSEEDIQRAMQASVVRVIGSLSEGSGFPVSGNEILTSFHVIEGEPSPKVVFPDGTFAQPIAIRGSWEKDLALLRFEKKFEPLPFAGFYGTSYPSELVFGEPVYAAGYPLGSDLPGPVSVAEGSFSGKRFFADFGMTFIQTDISISEGMSGGPLVDQCGQVIGMSTAGTAGLSVFTDIEDIQASWPDLSDEPIAKLEIDTSTGAGVIQAYYAYIKAQRLEEAFALVSQEKLGGNFTQWEAGFANTLHVDLVDIKEEEENIYFVKLVSSDWVEGELVRRFFEGTWEVREENGELKLFRSNIQEIDEPDWTWFYTEFTPPE